ncbi:MAG TPA: hypothetical protein VJ952_00955 [Opitutales bacterium]|nr:hypothetical protein [Opitutales bacterium]
MKLEKLNQWLSLLANLGVIVGLAFLIAELNQANRIAVYTAESTRSTQFIGMNTSRIENPEIIAKLMQPDPEFTDIEWVQALYTARQQINTWIDAENAVINGLLSETTRRGVFSDIDVVITEMPGLLPAWEYLFEAYRLHENTELETMAYLFRAVQEYKQDRAAQQRP